MIIGRVIGNVWATRKEENLSGLKLLIVQPIDSKNQPIRQELVVADRIGAGIDDEVLVTSGGAARYILSDVPLPIDAVVIGIIDSTEVRGEKNG
ncbi:MAG: EutN/CcmL family microcompartment protein [Solibacillus sp.]